MNVTVSPYTESDWPDVFRLLSGFGMYDDTEAHRDLMRRACALAAGVYLARDDTGALRATSALFRRSPSLTCGADLASDRRPGARTALAAVWDALREATSRMGAAVFTATPRPGDARVATLYRLAGLTAVDGEGDMQTPLPICDRLWEAVRDRGALPPRYRLDGHVVTFQGNRTAVDVDLRGGRATCRQTEGPDVGDVAAGPVTFEPLLPDGLEIGKEGCCKDVRIVEAAGRVVLAGARIALLAPWWAPIPTRGLSIPAHDHEPAVMTAGAAPVPALTLAYGGAQVLDIWHLGEGLHKFRLAVPPDRPYLRLALAARGQPVVRARHLDYPGVQVRFDDEPEEVATRAAGGGWRTYVHAGAPAFTLTVTCRAS